MKPGYKIENIISLGDIYFCLLNKNNDNKIILIGYESIKSTNVWKWIKRDCIGRWQIKGNKSK